MAGVSPEERIKIARLLLDEAADHLKDGIAGYGKKDERAYPFPELRQVQRCLHRVIWDLEHCTGCHPPYIREYQWQR